MEINMEVEILEHSIIGYQTEDGYEFYFNQFGELTDGDITYESYQELRETWIEHKPIFVPNYDNYGNEQLWQRQRDKGINNDKRTI
tara:strand:+ start:67 stop:324 length:258 start_codon:yes stop_codon:yes gene_type:complete